MVVIGFCQPASQKQPLFLGTAGPRLNLPFFNVHSLTVSTIDLVVSSFGGTKGGSFLNISDPFCTVYFLLFILFVLLGERSGGGEATRAAAYHPQSV